jgi:sigma-B regulation protein RsbU (phosphoserine phosphatase)
MSASRAKILIVDDEPANINIIAGLLKADHGLMVARAGEQALKAAHVQPPPDLILLDIMMPGMDGYEVCRRLKADPATRDIPVIFISAMGETQDETKGLDLGAVDYIVKPISAPILQARVRTHLALKHHSEKLEEAYAIIKLQKDRMQEELNVGRDIQMSMMPLDFPGPPACPAVALYASLQAAREVGGDFYDFGFLDDNRLFVCIGDVSGKGVPAALLMAVTKTLIKAGALQERSAAAVMTRVNDTISADNDKAMFVTVFLAICDVGTGEMVYCNAGHNPPYIQRASGELERLSDRHGMVVGGMEGLVYRESTTVLKPGDGLLLFTDGVTEAADNGDELFGEPRLLEFLERRLDEQPQALVESLVAGVRAFEDGAEQADDITVLALRFLGHGASQSGGDERVCRRWQGLNETAGAMAWFEQVAGDWGLADPERRKLMLALDDLLQNVITHAYPDGPVGEVELCLTRSGGRLGLALRDDGAAFNPTAPPPVDTSLSIEDREIGGLGLHLIEQIMDEVSYHRDGDWNCLDLYLSLPVSSV